MLRARIATPAPARTQPTSASVHRLSGTVAWLALILFVPSTLRLFHFAPLHADDLSLSLLAGLACLMWFEALKLYGRWASRRSLL